MKKTLLAILFALASCGSLKEAPKVPAESARSNYSIASSKENLEALVKFYEASLQKPEEENYQEHVVVVKTKEGAGQGYMIDDLGLVLTAFHNVKNISLFDSKSIYVTDKDEKTCHAQKTTLSDPDCDYIIIIAKTNKPQKTNPLYFAGSDEKVVGKKLEFVLSQHSYFIDAKKIDPTTEIISDDTALERVANGYGNLSCDEKERFRNVYKNLSNAGMIFMAANIQSGYSGGPVFTKDGYFIGLIKGSSLKDCNADVGILAGSENIGKAIEEYINTHR